MSQRYEFKMAAAKPKFREVKQKSPSFNKIVELLENNNDINEEDLLDFFKIVCEGNDKLLKELVNYKVLYGEKNNPYGYCLYCHDNMKCVDDVCQEGTRIDFIQCPTCGSTADIIYGGNGKYITKYNWRKNKEESI